tara:strand:- start:285 stop:719 length:435 start_codon:yes stop_codon:yes gene_type:complete
MPNETMVRFGYPETLIREYEHWTVQLRVNQVTLGSLILSAKAGVTAFSELPDAAFAEQALAVRDIERVLTELTGYSKINYLMLMMIDPNVHYHVFPRYEGERAFDGISIADAGWPGPPALPSATTLSDADALRLTAHLRTSFDG